MQDQGIMKKVLSFFSFEGTENELEEGGIMSQEKDKNDKVVPISKRLRHPEIQVFIPLSFEESRTIADNLKFGKAIVLNLTKLDVELGKRVVDFISGVIYALDGSFKRVADGVFVFSPMHIPLSADEHSNHKDRREKESSEMFFQER